MLDPDRFFDVTDRRVSRDAWRDRAPATSTNLWLVVVIVFFTIAGLVGYTAASQDTVLKSQGPGLGTMHGRLPLLD
jgi:hypothetical protein